MDQPDTPTPLSDLTSLLEALEQSLRRIASMPTPVPEHLRLSGEEWAEAVVSRGEAPYGRCDYCQSALGAVGCLNLCDMPTGMSRRFNDGLMEAINHRRAQVHWVENLAGCTCGPTRLIGYQSARESHDRDCPMN